MKSWYLPVVCKVAAALFFLNGCSPQYMNADPADKPKTSVEKNVYIFYPSLPEIPRYQYLTTFSSSSDVKKKKSKLFKFVAGDEEEKPQGIKKAYGVDIFDGVIYVCDVTGKAVVTLNLKKKEFGYIENTKILQSES